MSSRYDGKPFLRLLECYVLWSIGELSEKEKTALEKMTLKMQGIYNRSGEWYEVVAAEMAFSDNMHNLIAQVWQKNKANAKQSRIYLSPEHFFQIFVDKKF